MLANNLFPDEDAPLQKEATLWQEPRGYHGTAYHRIPSSPNTRPGANPLQKMIRLSPRASCTERRFGLQQRFPTPAFGQPQHPALFPGDRCRHQKPIPREPSCAYARSTGPGAPVSSCLPEGAVPVVSEFLAPLLWCFPRIGSASPSAPPHGRGEYMELNSQSQG